jgi:predicted alpha-1,6-mannanase (GH76 family)
MFAKNRYLACVNVGMAALQSFYNLSTGLWDTTGWWNSASVLETTIDYSAYSNSLAYRTNLFVTYEKNKHTNFLNPWFYDDEGWWALAWIKAYDLTGQTRYLEMAKTIFEDMKTAWDSTCGGGVWWKKQERNYKNAITIELFMTVAVRLHLRTPGDQDYLNWSQRSWNWFKNTGMLNSENLINDGLDANCRNNGQTTWTYNQGVILGGLVDLSKATNDPSLLRQAEAIASAAIRKLAPNGILREPCEPDCGDDGPQFKGVFMRNLYYLYEATKREEYKTFILQNAKSICSQNRSRENHFGLTWAGGFDRADAARQSAALDALVATIPLTRKSTAKATVDPAVEVFYGANPTDNNGSNW